MQFEQMKPVHQYEGFWPCQGRKWMQEVVIGSSPSENESGEQWYSRSNESSPVNIVGSSPDSELPSDRKARHKAVERNRRDKTRGYVQELQAILPNVTDNSVNPNINKILENTLEFLQSVDDPKNAVSSEEECDDEFSDVKPPHHALVQKTRMYLNDLLGQRFKLAFEHAPYGIAICLVDGTVIAANNSLETLLRFECGTMKGCTMFNLTCQQDLPKTMQVASALLSGRSPRVVFTKHCMRADGGMTSTMLIDMRCVFKDGRPHSFICYARPCDPSAELKAYAPPPRVCE